MHKHNNILLVSLGSNCLQEAFNEQFSEEDFPMERVSGFFDWMITSPQSIIEFLEHCKAGTVFDALSNVDNYIEVVNPDGGIFYKNTLFDCMYIWHPEQFRKNPDFSDIVTHKLNNLFNHTGKRYFILNNTSEQIEESMLRVNEDPAKFIITAYQHLQIKSLLKELFNGELILITNQKKSIGISNPVGYFSLESLLSIFS